MQTSNPFAPNGLNASLLAVGVSALLVQTTAEAVVLQPPVAVDAVPTLAPDQQTAQQIAIGSISTMATMMGLSAQVLGYANKFQAMYDTFLTLAQQIDDPATDPANRTEATTSFIEGLTSLMRTISTDQTTLVPLSNAVSSLIETAIPAKEALDSDLQAVQTTLADSEIPALEAQLTAIQQAIDADNQVIAKGTLHDLVDGIKMAIAIYKMGNEEVRAGLKSLIGTVQDMANTSNAIQEAMNDVNKQLALYQQTLEQLTADQLTWAVVQNLVTNMDCLTNYLELASDVLTAYNSTWQSQYDALETLSATLSDPANPQPVLTDYLTADLQTEWASLEAKASAMQQMPVVTIISLSPTAKSNEIAA